MTDRTDIGPLQPGERAPDFVLDAITREGKIAIDDFRGQKPVLVGLFRGLHCAFCRRHIAALAQLDAGLQRERRREPDGGQHADRAGAALFPLSPDATLLAAVRPGARLASGVRASQRRIHRERDGLAAQGLDGRQGRPSGRFARRDAPPHESRTKPGTPQQEGRLRGDGGGQADARRRSRPSWSASSCSIVKASCAGRSPRCRGWTPSVRWA